MAERPLSVRMPEDIDAVIRAKPERTAWLRDAIFEKLWREGNLPKHYHHLIMEAPVSNKRVKAIQANSKCFFPGSCDRLTLVAI